MYVPLLKLCNIFELLKMRGTGIESFDLKYPLESISREVSLKVGV